MDKTTSELGLPKDGAGQKQCLSIIGFLNIYHHEPWDLPGLSKVGEREWYFFVPRDRKNGHGGRPNRTTEKGFWKATDIGSEKTLVFYKGRAPRGSKTDWIMNEYRLPNTSSSLKCFARSIGATSLKVMEQRAAMEEESRMSHLTFIFLSIQEASLSHDTHQNFGSAMPPHDIVLKAEEEEEVLATTAKENLTELQLPKLHMDWTRFWTLLSPLLDTRVHTQCGEAASIHKCA
ncbi:hypothetical protein AAG906_025356 [Vitis piasezkii]